MFCLFGVDDLPLCYILMYFLRRTCVYVYVCKYIYIYIRLSLSIYIYIYMYMYAVYL